MEQFWFDFLSKQLPVIVVLGIFCYGMYKYFLAVVDKMDKKIEEQENHIKELNEKLLDVTVKCMDAINRNTQVIALLKERG